MTESVAPFQTSITYVGGRLVVVSRDGEGYRFLPEQLAAMLSFFDLMLAWTEPQAREIQVGPFLCRPVRECSVELPFMLANGDKVDIPVSPDWLERMRPVLERALHKLHVQPGTEFTLELTVNGTLLELPPDRTTLRP
jgi:hypothetical protein